MPAKMLKLVESHLKKSIGDDGIMIYKKSISKLNIGENPSKGDIQRLIQQIGDMIKQLYGVGKSNAIMATLHKTLIEEESGVTSNIDTEIDKLKLVESHLKKSIGDDGIMIYKKSISKLNIGENPAKGDIQRLIQQIGDMIKQLYGVGKSNAIMATLQKKLIEEESEVTNNIDMEINQFLVNNKIPTEKDITDYAKYLTMKYGGSSQMVEHGIIEKVKTHVKAGISRVKINEEIGNFLARYPEPTQKDVDDFIDYIKLSKLSSEDDELREQIEKERLFRKFNRTQEVAEPSDLDRFINFVRTSNDKEAIAKLMQKQGISYLIRDETRVSDKSLSELISLMAPSGLFEK
jgi:hypothetical protein